MTDTTARTSSAITGRTISNSTGAGGTRAGLKNMTGITPGTSGGVSAGVTIRNRGRAGGTMTSI